MDAIGEAIGDAFESVANHPLVGLGFSLVAAYVVVVWLATALWAFVDMRRRTSLSSAAYAAAAFIVLASPVLFLPAVAVYRILRPAIFTSERRLAELRERALEVEARRARCPECRRPVEDDWLICPDCRRTLGHRCHACGGTAGLEWSTCAWCGQELDGGRPTGVAIRA